jgi:radical SAM protein with 4Fe4S-binding SPASM domain
MIPCFPGFTRRFCDVDGNYRICERVDDSQAFVLGNVWDGMQTAQLRRIMEMRRHFGDCGNCTALKTCDICYARMFRCDRGQTGYDPDYDALCQQTRAVHTTMLQTYTAIMEENPTAFDRSYGSVPSRIHYGVHLKPLSPETMKKLECESLD